jgi:hypothetical protein
MKINPAIIAKLEQADVPTSSMDKILMYFLQLNFKLQANLDLSEPTKRRLTRLGIIDFEPSKGIYFKIPLLVYDLDTTSVVIKQEVIANQNYDELLLLFPSGGIKKLGYDLRQNKPSFIKKMSKFIVIYFLDKPDFTADTKLELIRNAITAYLNDRKKVNFQYTMKAELFVHHEEKGSTLASWCDYVLAKGVESPTFTNSFDV